MKLAYVIHKYHLPGCALVLVSRFTLIPGKWTASYSKQVTH